MPINKQNMENFLLEKSVTKIVLIAKIKKTSTILIVSAKYSFQVRKL